MCALIWFQDHIHRAGDFQKYSLHMDDEEFDYHLEFARIQKIFASVIIKEVILDTGISTLARPLIERDTFQFR
jgi:hypothetical protein